MDRKQWIAYIIAGVSLNCFNGIVGTFAMIKPYLSEEFQLQEGYLGILDGLNFFGRILGLTYLLFFPPKRPKLEYLIASIATLIILMFIPFQSIFGSYNKIAMGVCMFLSGFLRAYIFIPFLLLSDIVKAEDFKF